MVDAIVRGLLTALALLITLALGVLAHVMAVNIHSLFEKVIFSLR